MARRVIGLDVGTYSIKVAHLESRDRGHDFEVVTYAEKILTDFVAEKSLDEASAHLFRQEAALHALKAEGFFDGGNIVTGLSGADAQVRSLSVPFTNPKKIQAVLGGLLDAQLPLEIDDLVLSWFLRQSQKPEKKLDEKEAPSPHQILVAFARKESVAQYLELLKKTGADPQYLTHKAAALFDLLQYLMKTQHVDLSAMHRDVDQSRSPLYAVVDIGHRGTSVCVGNADRLILARSVLRGGYDVTRLLASRMRLSFEDAEKLKMDQALIEADAEKSNLPDQHLASETLKEGFLPVVRELRQTMLALESQGYGQLSHIFLVGGGSKVKNLDQFFASMLKISTVSIKDLGTRMPIGPLPNLLPGHAPNGAEAALATSYAISGHFPTKKHNRFDLRKDEFAWSGEYNFMRARAKTLSVWMVVLVAMLLMYGGLKNWLIGKEMGDLKEQESVACESVVGKKVDSGSRCLAMIKEQIAGQGGLGIPEFSAADVYLEVARVIPSNIQLKVTELDVSDKKVRINGETSGFEAVDQIVAGLAQARCFTNIEKGRARQVQSAINFQITADLECEPKKDDESSVRRTTKAKG